MTEIGIFVAVLVFALGFVLGQARRERLDIAEYDADTARMKKANDLIEKFEIRLGYDVSDEIRRRHPEEPLIGLSRITREETP